MEFERIASNGESTVEENEAPRGRNLIDQLRKYFVEDEEIQ